MILRCAQVYTEDTLWRNRAEFPQGRQQAHAFLQRKWAKELDYRLITKLWCSVNRITVRFAYEWLDAAGNWFRCYGKENWHFNEFGLMQRRIASINDLTIQETERLFNWPLGCRADEHPGLSDLGL